MAPTKFLIFLNNYLELVFKPVGTLSWFLKKRYLQKEKNGHVRRSIVNFTDFFFTNEHIRQNGSINWHTIVFFDIRSDQVAVQ